MTRALRVVQRNASAYRRVWRGSVFTSFLQPTLFLVAIGLGLGSLIDRNGAALPGHVRFLVFFAPGLLAGACMQIATFESAYPVLARMVWERTYGAVSATPVRIVDLVVGEILWIAVRLFTVATTFVLVMTAFGVPRSPWVILAVPAGVLTGLAFAAPIIAFAATRTTSATFNVLFRFGISPLFLFSGIFFPIERLPLPLRTAAAATPLFHGVALTRALTIGDGVPPGWIGHVAYLTVMFALGLAAALWTFRRRLHA